MPNPIVKRSRNEGKSAESPRSHAPAWECRLRRSASARHDGHRSAAERPGVRSHAEHGNEKTCLLLALLRVIVSFWAFVR